MLDLAAWLKYMMHQQLCELLATLLVHIKTLDK
jgi:hypothetical protein